MTKLAELAEGVQRTSETEEVSMGVDGPERTSQKLVSDDLDAAKALAKLAIDALKLSKSGLTERDADSETRKDLFDLAQDPWNLKKVE